MQVWNDAPRRRRSRSRSGSQSQSPSGSSSSDRRYVQSCEDLLNSHLKPFKLLWETNIPPMVPPRKKITAHGLLLEIDTKLTKATAQYDAAHLNYLLAAKHSDQVVDELHMEKIGLNPSIHYRALAQIENDIKNEARGVRRVKHTTEKLQRRVSILKKCMEDSQKLHELVQCIRPVLEPRAMYPRVLFQTEESAKTCLMWKFMNEANDTNELCSGYPSLLKYMPEKIKEVVANLRQCVCNDLEFGVVELEANVAWVNREAPFSMVTNDIIGWKRIDASASHFAYVGCEKPSNFMLIGPNDEALPTLITLNSCDFTPACVNDMKRIAPDRNIFHGVGKVTLYELRRKTLQLLGG